jgi:general stress protein 26
VDDKRRIRELLLSTNLGTLATVSKGLPECHLMFFAFSDDQKKGYFITGRDSTKFRHIKENPKVSILIDDRQHGLEEAAALTINGSAAEIVGYRRSEAINIFTRRNPQLATFTNDSKSVVIELTIDHMVLNSFRRS